MTSRDREILEKIHHINPTLNRLLSGPLFAAAAVTVALLLILPYRGRVALAFAINVLFNRPLVYLNYVARYVARPLGRVQMAVFYYLLFGIYAIAFRAFARRSLWGWSPASPQSESDFRYQS